MVAGFVNQDIKKCSPEQGNLHWEICSGPQAPSLPLGAKRFCASILVLYIVKRNIIIITIIINACMIGFLLRFMTT